MPVVQDGKFHGHVTSRTSFDTSPALLDFFSQIKRPFRVGTRCVQNSRNIVMKNDSRKEPNIDVTTELEDVVILPIS